MVKMNEIRIKEIFDLFYLNEKQLTAFQAEFVHSCKKYFAKNRVITEKQFAILQDIARYLPNEVRYSKLRRIQFTRQHYIINIYISNK